MLVLIPKQMLEDKTGTLLNNLMKLSPLNEAKLYADVIHNITTPFFVLSKEQSEKGAKTKSVLLENICLLHLDLS